DPRDGRPTIDMPPGNGLGGQPFQSDTMSPYYAYADAAVWDIGNPDPPITPAMEASGGRSMGRRLVQHGSYQPTRLGDATHQIRVVGTASGNFMLLYWQRRGLPSELFAELDVRTSFDIDWSEVMIEGSNLKLS